MDEDIRFDSSTDIDITGLEWWEVLQRLHWAAKVLHRPFSILDRPLTNEHAMELVGLQIQRTGFQRGFDVVNGRAMRVSFHTKHGQSWVRVNQYDLDAHTPARVTISALRRDKRHRMMDRE